MSHREPPMSPGNADRNLLLGIRLHADFSTLEDTREWPGFRERTLGFQDTMGRRREKHDAVTRSLPPADVQRGFLGSSPWGLAHGNRPVVGAKAAAPIRGPSESASGPVTADIVGRDRSARPGR